MAEMDWSTPAGLAAIKDHLTGRIDGWRQPVAWAVGITSASSDPSWQLPHVNTPGGRHGLAAVVLASVLRHDGSTATLALSPEQLGAAVEGLAPAEACAEVHHANLGVWRGLLAEVEGNPARELVAIFVADLADPITSDADGAMRATFEDLHPRT
ncbi:hypothetical protein [Janibacter limosus]|jgi:hypothetical protein|uniref:Uncharacterized protein n=1 Tax=Janibacter limosus TaxID=53458 RepID=A0A4P6MZK4_9MICO|nr:hypothetical protein [Janibacter limosus]QBF47183.1 hypothetical protein EXU32_13550 [Janibacter limosus]